MDSTSALLTLERRELSAPGVTPATIADATQLLSKLFSTATGAALLPSLGPYAAAALQGGAPPLRRLAVQQLGRLLAPGAGEVAASAQAQALELLVGALADDDLGAASDAEAALAQLAAPPAPHLHALLGGGQAGGARLAALAGSADPVLRLRALTLLVRCAAQSPGAAAAVQGSGLLQPLLSELQDPGEHGRVGGWVGDWDGELGVLHGLRLPAPVCDAS